MIGRRVDKHPWSAACLGSHHPPSRQCPLAYIYKLRIFMAKKRTLDFDRHIHMPFAILDNVRSHSGHELGIIGKISHRFDKDMLCGYI